MKQYEGFYANRFLEMTRVKGHSYFGNCTLARGLRFVSLTVLRAVEHQPIF